MRKRKKPGDFLLSKREPTDFLGLPIPGERCAWDAFIAKENWELLQELARLVTEGIK